MTFDQRKLDVDRVQKHVDELHRLFDSVHVFVTRTDPTNEQSVSVQIGAGNWFARYGQICEWVIKTDEGARCEARRAAEEGDE